MKDDYSDINLERERLENSSVSDILQSYYNKTPYSSDCVNRLQSCYDRCTEVLDNITMPEINLLWQLRHVPKGNQKLIFDFVQNNYRLWKSKALRPVDIVKYEKTDIDAYNDKNKKQ